jgi:hypothetical protein
MPAATTPDQVTAAYQTASGYWFRVYLVSRTATQISAHFESLGLNNLSCARGYVGPYLIGNDHLQGQYLIDCSMLPGGYKIAASWDLVPPGAVPAPLPLPPFP